MRRILIIISCSIASAVSSCGFRNDTNYRKVIGIDARINIQMVNRKQSEHKLEEGKFLSSFDQFPPFFPNSKGGNTYSSVNFEYKLDVRSEDFATIGATPIKKEVNGFSGATIIHKNENGLPITTSIVCESDISGSDGTDPANAPISDAFGGLTCPTGWTIYKNNSDVDTK